MKTSLISSHKLLGAAALALVCSLALPLTAQAKGNGKGKDRQAQKGRTTNQDGEARRAYSSHPRSAFVLSLGDGYAGRGYYYGPPNSAYYYQRSDVMYYATREAAPREYYRNSSHGQNSMGAAVQRQLTRRGYYNGNIDGQIGGKSRRAIVRYQQDNGLRVTGNISQGLIRSLGL
jgi:hypothetical protein